MDRKNPKKPAPEPQGEGSSSGYHLCADLGEDEEERLALLAAAITTLQKSSRFKNLFNQLELTVNERRIATEALVSITSRAGIECLSAETRVDKVLLQDTNEITFSDEDMEV